MPGASGALYRDEYPDLAEEVEADLVQKDTPPADKGQGNDMPHRGLLDSSVFEQLRHAARRMILEMYVGIPLPQRPVTRITPTQCERNEEIRLRHQQGETLLSLAEVFGVSENRVWQIVHRRRK